MLDAALIQQCADPSLKPAIVEQFVAAVGSTDPLAVTVKSGGRLVLVPKARSADEAMTIVRQYAGQAVVRVGLTQFPAGVGVKNAADLKPDLVDACKNLRKGTSMFAKILRIVTTWYGNPTAEDVFPQVFEDAVRAWKTGEFEGLSVYQAEDPGGPMDSPREPTDSKDTDATDEEAPSPIGTEPTDEKEIGAAGIRVDLSRISGQK